MRRIEITLPCCPSCGSSDIRTVHTEKAGTLRRYACLSCFAPFVGVVKNPRTVRRRKIPTVGSAAMPQNHRLVV